MILLMLILIMAALFTVGLLICESSLKPPVHYQSCSNCDYDLTGLPAQVDRCSECGCWFQTHPPRCLRPGGYDKRRLLTGLTFLLLFVIVLFGAMMLLNLV